MSSTPRLRTRSERPRIVSLALALVGAAAGVTCDTFTPREPPPPEADICGFSQQKDPQLREPLTPQILRDNIVLAFECPRTEFYEQSLNTEPRPEARFNGRAFAYFPDAGSRPLAPDEYWDAWNREQELQFALNLLDAPAQRDSVLPDTTLTLFLVSTQLEILRFEDTGQLPGTNDARYDVEYELTLTYESETNGGGVPVQLIRIFCGLALWDMTGGDRNFWTLFGWEDREPLGGTCSRTMGNLRVEEG